MPTTAHPSSIRIISLRFVTALIVLSVLMLTMVLAAPAGAVQIPSPGAGHRDFAYGAALDDPTEDKPQSKVWFNDGSWWGGLWNPTAGEHQIHKLVGQDWVATGVAVDDRSRSHGDYLWDGTALYVASVSGDSQDEPIFVYRYTYNAGTDTYALDPAFVEDHDGDPTLEEGRIAGQGRSESVTIAKEATGQLWITYTNNIPATTTRNVMVNASQAGGQHVWGAPFALPTAPVVTDDDISAIVQLGGAVGVMWTNQSATGGNGSSFGFSVHPDGNADAAWGAAETAASNADVDFVDDHLSLRTAADGRVLAAVKTNAGPDHIQLLVRGSGGGWTSTVVVGEGIGATRPQVVIDGTNSRAYVLYTIPVLDSDTGDQQIFYKSAPLASLTFGTGNGTAFIADPGIDINDISTSKHAVTAATALLGVAASETNDTYYHGFLALGAAPSAPATPTGLAGAPASTSQINLSWNGSAGATSYRVYRNGAPVGDPTGTTFNDTGLATNTSYSYTVDAANAAGRSLQSAAVNVKTMRDVGRVAGANRFATAVELSKLRFPAPPATLNVFIATGSNFPDALSAAPAAGLLEGPVLLVTLNAIPAETKAELSRLSPSRIYVVGGPSVISEAVLNELAGYTDGGTSASIERRWGANRFGTAASVSDLFPVDRPAVFIATGRNFPDALAAGPAATLTDAPVLLVEGNSIPANTAAALTRLSPQTIYIAGGPVVVSENVRVQLKAFTDSHSDASVVRLAGADRFATGVEIVKRFWPGTAPRSVAATGMNFPDALAGGAYALPLHLVRPNAVPSPVPGDVARLNPSRIDVLGGPVAVSDGVIGVLRVL